VATADDIASVPLFGALEDAQLAQVAQWFHVEHASEGVTLVGEGSHGYTFFVLANGTAAVTCDGATVASLGPGDFFGEVAMLGAGRRTATVRSTSPVHLLVMFGTEFRQLEAAYPEVASRLTAAMEARLAGAPS
jgi:CRP-like cAMP-binding protein